MVCGHSIAAGHDSVELGTRDKRATAWLWLHHHAQALKKADLRGPIFQRRADLVDLRIGEVWPWIVHVSLHEKAPQERGLVFDGEAASPVRDQRDCCPVLLYGESGLAGAGVWPVRPLCRWQQFAKFRKFRGASLHAP